MEYEAVFGLLEKNNIVLKVIMNIGGVLPTIYETAQPT